jgi:hypothetical protein
MDSKDGKIIRAEVVDALFCRQAAEIRVRGKKYVDEIGIFCWYIRTVPLLKSRIVQHMFRVNKFLFDLFATWNSTSPRQIVVWAEDGIQADRRRLATAV